MDPILMHSSMNAPVTMVPTSLEVANTNVMATGLQAHLANPSQLSNTRPDIAVVSAPRPAFSDRKRMTKFTLHHYDTL